MAGTSPFMYLAASQAADALKAYPTSNSSVRVFFPLAAPTYGVLNCVPPPGGAVRVLQRRGVAGTARACCANWIQRRLLDPEFGWNEGLTADAPAQPAVPSIFLLVDVRDPVVVIVAFFILTDVAVVPISSAQQNRGKQSGQQ